MTRPSLPTLPPSIDDPRRAIRPTGEGAPRRRIAWILGALAVVGGIALLDDLTGPDFAFVLIYLVPVLATGWWQGRGAAIIVALAASLSWTLVFVLGGDVQTPAVGIWNSLTRLVIFTGAGWLIAQLRANQDHLTELARREADLARIDPLTLLPNWRAFEELLQQAIARRSRLGGGLILGYADLDNFKRVNDLHGHAAGDDLLRQLGGALREALRTEDVVARVGGDEFTVLTECSEPAVAELIGERLRETISRLAREVPDAGLGTSLGLLLVDRPAAWAQRTTELVQRADAAMYEAKRAGKNRVVILSLADPPPP